MFLRQSTEVNDKISFVSYVKVSDDPGAKPIRLARSFEDCQGYTYAR